jgi:iron complex transport system ATP-binding protein
MLSLLQAQNLAIGYAGPRGKLVPICTGLNLEVHAGEFIFLLGPNGAGKSTLLRTLAGLQPAAAGSVTLMGQPYNQYAPMDVARRRSVVLTERIPTENLRVEELVALGRAPYTGLLGRLSAADQALVEQALHAMHCDTLRTRRLYQLSDGELQRAAIARALVQIMHADSDAQPALLVLDEPTAHLDVPSRIEILELLRRQTRQRNVGVLLSSHELELAIQLADRLWILKDAVMTQGLPEDLVLGGELNNAFATPQVALDAHTGQFRICMEGTRPLALVGEGPAAAWTRRALQRMGYALQENARAADVSVTVRTTNEGTFWFLDVRGFITTCRNIGHLARHLAEKYPQ